MSSIGFALAPGIEIGGGAFPVIAGPCVIESSEQVLEVATIVQNLAERLAIPIIFKASFDKANRSSISSFRGPGLEEGLEGLDAVAKKTGLPILTDVHAADQCSPAAQSCDILQIPAFLCRQTDLIVAAAETGRPVNIKKGQFMAPDDMLGAVEKARSTGNTSISVTERGYSFGYHNLVVDMRSFALMQQDGIPVIFDVTHSLQLPGGGEQTGGDRRFAAPLTRAAVAAGADGLYLEVHPCPEDALSDRTTQLTPSQAEALLRQALAVRRAVLEVEGEVDP